MSGDESEAQLDLIKQSLDQYARSIPPPPDRPRTEFPTGPNVTVSDGWPDNHIRSFQESPSDGLRDLDSGRYPRPPQELVKNSPGHEPSKELLAWAEQEGVDLINIKITPLGSGKPYYAFLPVGMKVWRIANDRFDDLEKELRKSKTLELPAPWEGPLAQVDEKSGAYDEKLIASFLFITKEGTCGAIQLKSPLSEKFVPGTPVMRNGGMLVKFICEGEAEK